MSFLKYFSTPNKPVQTERKRLMSLVRRLKIKEIKVSPSDKKRILKFQDKNKDRNPVFSGTLTYIDRGRPLTRMEKFANKKNGRKFSRMDLRYKNLKQLDVIAKRFKIDNWKIKERPRLQHDIFMNKNNKR